jgi:NADPH-dependent 2,4-dienoyl-CoA reductase/sulfur reductase-like enzyme
MNSITSRNKLSFNGSQEVSTKYDVTVVGRGPSGLMAARTAAENGLKVLLIERKKELETMLATYHQTALYSKNQISILSVGGPTRVYTEPPRG